MPRTGKMEVLLGVLCWKGLHCSNNAVSWFAACCVILLYHGPYQEYAVLCLMSTTLDTTYDEIAFEQELK